MEFLSGLMSTFMLSIIVVPILLLLAYLIEEVSAKFVTFLLVIGTAVSYVFFNPSINIFAYIWYHPLQSLTLVATYLLAGLIYSFFKWWRFLHAEKRKWEYQWKAMPEGDERDKTLKMFMPKAKKNLDYIATWIIYWPFSLVWTLISDILTRVLEKVWNFVKEIVKQVSNIYDKITDYVWSRI